MRGNGAKLTRGVTLIELLLTLVLLIGLSGITLGVFRQTSTRAKETQTQTLLRLLEYSLEQYALDHGGKYPVGNGSLESAQTLYQKLVEGEDGEGSHSPQRGYGSYLTQQSGFIGENDEVVDSYGNYIRYVFPQEHNQLNPSFRLWSIGAEEIMNRDSFF